VNKFGKVTPDKKWHVKVGKKWRVFDEDNFQEGIEWIQGQLG
jgi:hypothetical protein